MIGFTTTYNDFDYTGAVFRTEQSYSAKEYVRRLPLGTGRNVFLTDPDVWTCTKVSVSTGRLRFFCWFTRLIVEFWCWHVLALSRIRLRLRCCGGLLRRHRFADRDGQCYRRVDFNRPGLDGSWRCKPTRVRAHRNCSQGLYRRGFTRSD